MAVRSEKAEEKNKIAYGKKKKKFYTDSILLRGVAGGLRGWHVVSGYLGDHGLPRGFECSLRGSQVVSGVRSNLRGSGWPYGFAGGLRGSGWPRGVMGSHRGSQLILGVTSDTN
jgi:hypothetical protein